MVKKLARTTVCPCTCTYMASGGRSRGRCYKEKQFSGQAMWPDSNFNLISHNPVTSQSLSTAKFLQNGNAAHRSNWRNLSNVATGREILEYNMMAHRRCYSRSWESTPRNCALAMQVAILETAAIDAPFSKTVRNVF